jgi:hypothetical protein
MADRKKTWRLLSRLTRGLGRARGSQPTLSENPAPACHSDTDDWKRDRTIEHHYGRVAEERATTVHRNVDHFLLLDLAARS